MPRLTSGELKPSLQTSQRKNRTTMTQDAKDCSRKPHSGLGDSEARKHRSRPGSRRAWPHRVRDRGRVGNPEENFMTANDGDRPARGGFFKSQHDRDQEEMDSPNATDSKTLTETEEKQADAGTRTLEETTARGLP
ncbi:hypothetical protein NDU88_005571 [Pleurodeles waltl]|uniref:Uncharacterized protein n=1 Tax=Pleurodeles waltl TaxID=8319 RepID=A0AAV7ULG2_PLEWA|nr:hypothetical protein NDU88_005571 [Pleurodeles waltl]